LSVFPIATVPIVIIAGLTSFPPESNKVYQRVLVLLWIFWGCFCGPIFITLVEALIDPHCKIKLTTKITYLIYIAVLGTPAITGFVAVGLMMKQYGTCFEVFSSHRKPGQ
jgi:hypothetical protein